MTRTARIAAGDTLPELVIAADPTFVISTALATRDFQDVHHDRDKALARGSKDIFVNILTDTGLVQRFVTDWAGSAAVIGSIKLRLGVPWYANDILTLTGKVAAVEGNTVIVSVLGKGSLGDHITATVTFETGTFETGTFDQSGASA